jgi:hypothetical protein
METESEVMGENITPPTNEVDEVNEVVEMEVVLPEGLSRENLASLVGTTLSNNPRAANEKMKWWYEVIRSEFGIEISDPVMRESVKGIICLEAISYMNTQSQSQDMSQDFFSQVEDSQATVLEEPIPADSNRDTELGDLFGEDSDDEANGSPRRSRPMDSLFSPTGVKSVGTPGTGGMSLDSKDDALLGLMQSPMSTASDEENGDGTTAAGEKKSKDRSRSRKHKPDNEKGESAPPKNTALEDELQAQKKLETGPSEAELRRRKLIEM